MKALVYTTQAKMDGRKVIEPGKCELLDIPEPQLLPTDDMKIRVDYCAMCATDVHIVTMGLYGMPAPWIMGHELCGTIVEVNPRATENGFAVGDKVVVNCTAPCGCCDECKRGHDIFCKHPIAGSFVHGFTEYCTAVCEQVFQIPKNSPIDPKYYCLAEPMASAMDGMDLADIKIGDNVLLQGCGAIGSIILNMLLLKGGANVTVSDPIAEKRETALKLGAQYVIDPKNEDLKERAMEITNGRGSLYGYRLGTSQLLFWLMTVLWLPLINLLMSGGMAQDKAYFTAAIIFTVPGLLFAVLLYRNSREVVEPQKSTKLPAKDLWHFVIQNGPLLMVMFGQFVCGIYMYGRSGVMMYYFTYYAGNTNLFTIYNLIAIGCGIAGPFTAPILMEKCGNKGRIVALGAIGSGALFVAMNFINAGTNPLLFYIFAGVSGYFNGLIMAAVYACMLDTIEVGQYKTGIRASAFAVSLCHFANKLGMTISTAGVGAVLAALGFAANQTQNGDVLFWINGFFTWVPGVIGIVVGVVFLFYKLNRERYYEILAKLKEKAE